MYRMLALSLALTALLVAAPAGAQSTLGDCMIGPALGSTLLVPYFEVDLDDPNGVTTILSINNGRNDPALVRVVLWTDWGVPTLAFDVYLLGFDVQPINVRTIFAGNVPSTGEGADLSGFEFRRSTSTRSSPRTSGGSSPPTTPASRVRSSPTAPASPTATGSPAATSRPT